MNTVVIYLIILIYALLLNRPNNIHYNFIYEIIMDDITWAI